MRIPLGIAFSLAVVAVSHARSDPRWAADPSRAGPDLPPVGRSLFDFAMARSASGGGARYDVPFPFAALVSRIEALAGCAPGVTSCTRQVLIPLGRSLQRTAAAPDFFAHPRVVVAVDREGAASAAGGMLLKDRLYLGYQEAAALIEVISYNEAAARFEFQVVTDYRPGGTPRVAYARRSVCTACHQNLGPLFSRPQWDETNANPRVAAELGAERSSFHGVSHRVGVEVPAAIDDATDRANRLLLAQVLWREGCGEAESEAIACRAAALTAAFQYRLSGERGFSETDARFVADVADVLARSAAARWSGGLAVPNPDIPNRDPFALARGATGLARSHVTAGLEPLLPRAPLEIWAPGDPRLARRFVEAIAGSLGDADVRAIDAELARLAKANGASERSFRSTCDVRTRSGSLAFRCRPAADDDDGAELAARLVLDPSGGVAAGEIDAVAVGAGEALRNLEIDGARVRDDDGETVVSFTPVSRGLHARFPDGRAIDEIELRWRGDDATVRVTVADDFAPLGAALGAIGSPAAAGSALALPVFRRGAMMAALGSALGLRLPDGCCEDATHLPDAEASEVTSSTGALAPVAAVFREHCAACHETSQRFPPNFLYGDEERVAAALAACAPRILVRVGMWQVRPGERAKTPMPPPFPLAPVDEVRERRPSDAVIASLEEAAAVILQAEGRDAPSAGELLARGYEQLPPCLPADL